MGKHTLLLRLEGPMQSWGVDSQLTERLTTGMPTKTGVVGLLCAAMGRDRKEKVDDLAALRMGVRIDSPGQLMTDFQIAQNVRRGSAKASPETVMTHRQYLCDASFLVGLESEDEDLLIALEYALQNPVYLLALGRKAYPPSIPVTLPRTGVRAADLERALTNEPLRGQLSAIAFIEDENAEIPLADVPTGAFYQMQNERHNGIRYVRPLVIGEET